MLMLLDSAGLYFRAYFGTPSSMTAPDGTPVNAVRGFLDTCAALVSARQPTHLVACWDDDWRPAWRVDLIADYKAHRALADGSEDAPAALLPQVEMIIDLLAALGVSRVGAPDYEADDVIATLARQAAGTGQRVEVVTGDRDLFQVIDDARGIEVLYTARGVTRPEVLNEEAVLAAHGVRPQQYVDYAVLRGDPSDGLPGIRGVGTKTAAALLAQFGSLSAIMAAAESGDERLRPRIANALREGRDYVRRAELVVRAAAAPVELPECPVPFEPANPAALAVLARRWGVEDPVARLVAALHRAATGSRH